MRTKLILPLGLLIVVGALAAPASARELNCKDDAPAVDANECWNEIDAWDGREGDICYAYTCVAVPEDIDPPGLREYVCDNFASPTVLDICEPNTIDPPPYAID